MAVLDACVLVPMPVADTLLRLAEPPALYDPRWTEEILAEVTRTLVVGFGKTRERALYREAAMREFFRESMVAGPPRGVFAWLCFDASIALTEFAPDSPYRVVPNRSRSVCGKKC